MSKLSNRQNVRLGGLIAVMGGREPYSTVLNDLQGDGLVSRETNGSLSLTEKGVGEKDRLAILAGLMVENDYVQDKPKNLDVIMKASETDD